MITIKKHIEQETNKERLKELAKILNRGTITLEEWRMTGKFIPKEEYKSDNPNVKLKRNCQEVVEYAGASIIQVLSTGEFVFNDAKSRSLDEVENVLWAVASEKLWCENC